MVHTGVITAAAAAGLLAALPVNAGLYPKSSAVLQVDGKNYDRLIAQSNHTSIVEFYAPWCGHCKNLQPAYEKAAKTLAGLAKVAAVDCDDESNKPFCGQFGVQGFPTLKIVKPGSKPGRPIVEDYNGPRTAKGIVEAVTEKIPNLVKRVTDKELESFLAEANDTAKALLFTDKGKTSSLLKAVAIDFKGSIKVAQIRNTDKASVELFGITTFPTLVLLPGGSEAKSIVYDGEMKKEGIVKFLSQAAAPNPDPAPAKAKVSKKKDDKKAGKKAKESFEKASASHAKEDGKTGAATATEEVLEEEATESPSPEVDTEKPIVLPETAPPIPTLIEEETLQRACLGEKTGTCILALIPETPNDVSGKILDGLAEIAHRKRDKMPFYTVPSTNTGFAPLKSALGLTGSNEVIAINSKRSWWRSLTRKASDLTEDEVTIEAILTWIDAVKMGEGTKEKLPETLVVKAPVDETLVEEPAASEEQKPIVIEPVVDETTAANAEEAEPKTREPATPAPEETAKVEDTHDEL